MKLLFASKMKIKTWFLINEVMLCGGTTKKFRESEIPDQSGKVACLNFMGSTSMDFWKVKREIHETEFFRNFDQCSHSHVFGTFWDPIF